MKRGSISSTLFALACLAAAGLSAQILGAGIWGTAFVVFGGLVASGPYFRAMREPARAIALLAAIVAFLAVALGLLAATIGGTFRLPNDQALLLTAIGLIGVFGIAAFRTLQSGQSES